MLRYFIHQPVDAEIQSEKCLPNTPSIGSTYVSVFESHLNLKVSSQDSVVAVIRKHKSPLDPEHTFIVVESFDNDKELIVFTRYDLLFDNKIDEKTGHPYAKIEIDSIYSPPLTAKRNLKILVHANEFVHQAFQISKQNQKLLDTNIKNTQANPPFFNAYGASSLSNLSPVTSLFVKEASLFTKSHNCYSWIRSELNKIGIVIPESLETIFAEIPSRALPDPKVTGYCSMPNTLIKCIIS